MIEINNLTNNPVDEKFLKKVAKIVLKKEKKEKLYLSIAFVNKKRIRELNKKYRKKDRSTDVLSFTYNKGGETVICPQEVKKNAKKFNSTFKKELARVLIHGILHLLGYNHEKLVGEAKPRTRINSVRGKKMEEKENYYLNLCQNLKS